MQITLRLFAVLRERAGFSERVVEMPAGAKVAAVSDLLLEIEPRLAPYLPRVAYAVNRSYSALDADLHDGDEVAVIPPVSGG